MKRKLDTRFPAARIKKIMQTDEEVGKIAQATPVLVSKALEMFLQDLCRKTYDITADRGAKTVSEAHLKQCVGAHPEFDFLMAIVSKASEGGGEEPDDHTGDGNRHRSTLDEDSEEEDIGPRVPQRKEQSLERSSSKGRSKPAKSVAKVSSEHVSDPPTLPAKKSSRSTKAPKGNIAAPKRDSKEVESLEVGPPPIAKVEQETELSEPCKASPRGFDLNLDPKAEGDDLGHDNNSLDEVLEPRSFMVPKLEVVLEDAEVGVGELVPSYVEPPTTLVTTFKPMSVEEDDDYDCND